MRSEPWSRLGTEQQQEEGNGGKEPEHGPGSEPKDEHDQSDPGHYSGPGFFQDLLTRPRSV